MTYALDSWAVLRLLEGTEPTASRVQEIVDLERPTMSWVNLGEVYYVVRRDRGAGEAEELVRDLQPRLTLEAPAAHRVLEAARLKADHQLAYADAFAAATAIAHDATLLTGDPELLVAASPWRWEDLGAGDPR